MSRTHYVKNITYSFRRSWVTETCVWRVDDFYREHVVHVLISNNRIPGDDIVWAGAHLENVLTRFLVGTWLRGLNGFFDAALFVRELYVLLHGGAAWSGQDWSCLWKTNNINYASTYRYTRISNVHIWCVFKLQFSYNIVLIHIMCVFLIL